MRPQHIQRYIDAFEQLTPATLQPLHDCLAERAHFVDPFNDVRGRAAIRHVFEHMFASCEDPKFRVDECVGDDSLVYLRWHFSFGGAAARHRFQGVSRVRFTSDGLVTEHLDYWDPASQLYENIPIIGRLFRALRHRLAAPQRRDSRTNPFFRLPSRGTEHDRRIE